jgi:F0F1-type ATP synthase gamma subunit
LKLTKSQLQKIIKEELDEVHGEVPHSQRVEMVSIGKEETNILEMTDNLLEKLELIGDYHHYDMISNVLKSMNENYKLGRQQKGEAQPEEAPASDPVSKGYNTWLSDLASRQPK